MSSAEEEAYPYCPGPRRLCIGCAARNCRNPSATLRCSDCLVARYCDADHQRADRYAHRHCCQLIRMLRDVRASDPSPPSDSLVFLMGLRTLALAQASIPTVDAVRAALENLLWVLQLDESDPLRVRAVIPELLLRLGQDQEAYDFIKWWTTRRRRGEHAEFLDLDEQDVFEPVKELDPRDGDGDGDLGLAFLSILALLKLRLAMDMHTLEASANLGPEAASQEGRLARILRLGWTNVAPVRMEFIEEDGYGPRAKKLWGQVRELAGLIEERNPHFFPMLFEEDVDVDDNDNDDDDDDDSDSPATWRYAPGTYPAGSREEAHTAMQETCEAWQETLGAIALVKKFLGGGLGLDKVKKEVG